MLKNARLKKTFKYTNNFIREVITFRSFECPDRSIFIERIFENLNIW
jgi:hypothetical protein